MTLQFSDVRLLIPEGGGELSVRGEIQAGERVVLRGPSGCGKTTLLRAVAGLYPLTSGKIFLGAEDWTTRPAWERDVGLVFQGGALFPHLSVEENVLCGLKFRRRFLSFSPELQKKRAQEFLTRAGLENLGARDVQSLSGGERQRVGLLRALIGEPKLLLLDEPLSAVDPERRVDLQDWILESVEEKPVPLLWVTHDEAEARRVGTRVVEWPAVNTWLEFSQS